MFEEGGLGAASLQGREVRVVTWLKRRGLILGSTHESRALGFASPVNIPYNRLVLDYVLAWPAPGSTALSVANVLPLSPLRALVMYGGSTVVVVVVVSCPGRAEKS